MENLVVCNSIFVGHPFHEIRSAAVQAHLVVHEATDYTGDIISPIIEDIRQLRDDVWELVVWGRDTIGHGRARASVVSTKIVLLEPKFLHELDMFRQSFCSTGASRSSTGLQKILQCTSIAASTAKIFYKAATFSILNWTWICQVCL